MRGVSSLGGHDEVWAQHGACLDHHEPDLWFPESGPAHEARQICAGCPVRSDCLQAALLEPEEHGIWGGVSERQRRGLRRLLLACPHPTLAQKRDGCRCKFCKALREQDRRMVKIRLAAKVERLDTNGPGATCGTASSYARGCHCEECTEAMRASRKRNNQRREQEAGEFRPSLGQRLAEEAARRREGAVA